MKILKVLTLIVSLASAYFLQWTTVHSITSIDTPKSFIAPKPTATALIKDELELVEDAFKKGKWDEAIPLLNAFLSKNPSSIKALVIRGTIFLYQNKQKLASADILEAIRLKPVTAADFSAHAGALALVQDYDKAMADIDEAIKKEPKNVVYVAQKLGFFLQQGQFDKALAEADHIIKIAPKSGDGYIYKGSIYQSQNKYDLAISAYSKATAVDPTSGVAFNNLAWLYALTGKGELAVKNCLKAVKINPKSPAALDTCGLAYFVKGDIESSIKYYDEAISLAPGAPMSTSYCYRGRSNQQAGNQIKAIEDYQTCLKFNEGGDLVKMAQDGLKTLGAK